MINLGPYSGKNCPNVRLTPTIIDRLLEGIALLLLLILCFAIYFLYTQKGGSLSTNVWVMGGVSVFSTILIGVCAYVSVSGINFPVRVNERNIGIQYLLAIRFTRVLNIVLNLIFLSGVFMEYYKIAQVFFSIGFVVLALAFIVYFVIAYRHR